MIVNNNSVIFKKAIEVKPEDLTKLENILLNYGETVKYEAILKDGRTVEFNDLNELITYENDNESKIIKLTIRTDCETTLNRIAVHCRVKGEFLKGFKYTVELEYKLEDEEKEIVFNKRIDSWFSSISQNGFYDFCSKVSSNIINSIICLLMIIVSFRALFFVFSNWNSGYYPIEYNIAAIFLGIMLLIFISLDAFWKYLFPPIVFLIGNEIKNNKTRKTVKTVVLGTVILGIIVSVSATFIANGLSTLF